MLCDEGIDVLLLLLPVTVVAAVVPDGTVDELLLWIEFLELFEEVTRPCVLETAKEVNRTCVVETILLVTLVTRPAEELDWLVLLCVGGDELLVMTLEVPTPDELNRADVVCANVDALLVLILVVGLPAETVKLREVVPHVDILLVFMLVAGAVDELGCPGADCVKDRRLLLRILVLETLLAARSLFRTCKCSGAEGLLEAGLLEAGLLDSGALSGPATSLAFGA